MLSTGTMVNTFIIASALLLGKCRKISSWILLPSHSAVSRRVKYARSIGVIEASRPSIFYEDEEECPNEEECEIDWSSMPGFEDNDDDEIGQEPIAVESPTTITSSEDPDCPEEEECEIDWSLMPGFDDDDENKIDEETTIALESPSSIFNSDDPDCPEEEECEIDWSMMPGFDDDDADDTEKEESNPSGKMQNVGPVEERYEEINEKLNELEPKDVYVRQLQRSTEKSRTHLEMNWQIADCVVDKDTCTDICSDCSGSGKVQCQFCHGTGNITFLNELRSCILCKDGLTDCKACVGTGSIASWAKTHDGSS